MRKAILSAAVLVATVALSSTAFAKDAHENNEAGKKPTASQTHSEKSNESNRDHGVRRVERQLTGREGREHNERSERSEHSDRRDGDHRRHEGGRRWYVGAPCNDYYFRDFPRCIVQWD